MKICWLPVAQVPFLNRVPIIFSPENRSKFRAKVLAEHPDKGGDPKKFQMLNKAYNVLTDTEKRRRYDTTGRAEKSAEEEFVEGFAGGRHHFEPRTKEKSWKTWRTHGNA